MDAWITRASIILRFDLFGHDKKCDWFRNNVHHDFSNAQFYTNSTMRRVFKWKDLQRKHNIIFWFYAWLEMWRSWYQDVKLDEIVVRNCFDVQTIQKLKYSLIIALPWLKSYVGSWRILQDPLGSCRILNRIKILSRILNRIRILIRILVRKRIVFRILIRSW